MRWLWVAILGDKTFENHKVGIFFGARRAGNGGDTFLSSCLPLFYCFLAAAEGCIIGNMINKTYCDSAKPIRDSFLLMAVFIAKTALMKLTFCSLFYIEIHIDVLQLCCWHCCVSCVWSICAKIPASLGQNRSLLTWIIIQSLELICIPSSAWVQSCKQLRHWTYKGGKLQQETLEDKRYLSYVHSIS